MDNLVGCRVDGVNYEFGSKDCPIKCTDCNTSDNTGYSRRHSNCIKELYELLHDLIYSVKRLDFSLLSRTNKISDDLSNNRLILEDLLYGIEETYKDIIVWATTGQVYEEPEECEKAVKSVNNEE